MLALASLCRCQPESFEHLIRHIGQFAAEGKINMRLCATSLHNCPLQKGEALEETQRLIIVKSKISLYLIKLSPPHPRSACRLSHLLIRAFELLGVLERVLHVLISPPVASK